MKRILNNLKYILFILIFFLSISTCFSLEGSNIEMQDTVNIYDKQVSIPIYISNNTNNQRSYTIKTNIPSFKNTVSPSTFLLDPSSSKKVILKLDAIENSLFKKYRSTIDIYSNNSSSRKNITIIQNNNKKCLLDINTNVDYKVDIQKYFLNIQIENPTYTNQELIIKNIKNVDLNISNTKINIDSKSTKDYKIVFDSNSSYINIEYICNYNTKNLKVDLPKKIKQEFKDSNKNILTPLLNLKNIKINWKSIYNSIFFQIFLLIILVILILSFTTKYIKYVYKK